MQQTIALIGSGNVFFKDEGIGLYAAKYIKENYSFEPDNIKVVDGGTLGFKLMPLLQEYKDVIIINTASDDIKKVGDIILKTTDEFLDGTLIKKTANEVEIAEMLQICSITENMANTTVISIIPDDIVSVSVSLSKSMMDSWDCYIQTVIDKIESLGIKASKEEKISLDAILHIFANPSIEFNRGF